MYIEISNSFADALKATPSQDMWTLLDYAMYAAKEGRHIISCESRKCADVLVQLARYNSKKKLESFFRELKDGLSELRNIKSMLSHYVFLTSKETTDEDQSQSVKKSIEIGVNIGSFSDLWLKSRLLVENSEDGFFYQLIADYEKKKNPTLDKVLLNFDIAHGGGVDIHNEFVRFSNEKRPLLCFVDSDKKYPSDSLGGTASHFGNNEKKFIYLFHILDTCELENLFFSKEFSANLNCGKNTSPIDQAIANYESGYPSIRLYFDVKKGFLRKNVLCTPFLKKNLHASSTCVKRSVQCYKKCKRCEDYVIEGYCRTYFKCLKKKYDKKGVFNQKSFFKDADLLPSNISDQWNLIGKMMLDWGCGYKINSHGI